MFYVMAVAIAMVLLVGFNLVFKKFKHNTTGWLYKTISLVLAGVFVVRFMSADIVLEQAFALTATGMNAGFETFVSLTLTWFSYAAILLVILNSFFEVKTAKWLVATFALPVAILDLVFLNTYLAGIVGTETQGLRAFLLVAEIGILLGYGLQFVWLQVLNLKQKTKKTTNKEKLRGVATTIFALLGILLASMPAFLLRGYFGDANPNWEAIDFTIYHRLFLYAGFLIPFVVWAVLHNKDEQVKRFGLLMLSLGTLLTFSVDFKFDMFSNPTHLPLHLCNTAMYIVAFTLIFKTEKVFYFTFFINVLGALLAMLMPNYGVRNLTEVRLMVFWTNHLIAFFMPLLIVALKIYPRPKMKQFKYSLIAFSVYFVAILFINAWFSNYGSVDYFFTNSDFITDKLGQWANNLRNITFEFDINELHFVFYPIYQALFYLVYVAASFAMWFVYEQFYVFSDQMADMAKRKKQLKMDKYLLSVALNGRGEHEPMNLENENKLVLKHFAKKYGNSDVWAVKDANLEVHSGEIFGFLGPNGAGKSTIIKSIVGIQPITSGSIEVSGYDVDKQSVQTKRLIGFVPDHYALYEKLTGREYINYIADLYKVSQKDRDERIGKYVKAFELQHAFDNQMNTYSHGMKQKIAIMSALVHEPKLWILDEPLTGLDPTSIYQVKLAMKQHAEKGNIVFFSSHIIDVVENLCDRIAIIKKGQIQAIKTLDEIEASGTRLEDFYLTTIGEKLNTLKGQRAKRVESKKEAKPAAPKKSASKKAPAKKAVAKTKTTKKQTK